MKNLTINWQNQKTYQLIDTMNPALEFNYQKEYPQYHKNLNNRHKVVQLVHNGKTKEFFEYMKKKGKFLGYSIHEERKFGDKKGFNTILSYIYLCNNYYCTIEINMSESYEFNPNYKYRLHGSHVSISK